MTSFEPCVPEEAVLINISYREYLERQTETFSPTYAPAEN
jgi:hypothetical protein